MKIIEVSSENRLCVDMNARNQVTLWSCIGPTNVHTHELTPEQAKWLAHELNVRAKKLEPKDER